MDPTNGSQIFSKQKPGALYPVGLAFILHHCVLAIASIGLPYSIFNPFDFVRSDSTLYFDIARNGYELFHCNERFSAYSPDNLDWCGNAGWMPLYAWLLRPFLYLGVHQDLAAFFLSRISYLAVLFFIYSLSAPLHKRLRILVVLTAAIFPSAIYYSAAFPISLMLAMLLGSFYFWQKNRIILAMIMGFMVPLSYSTGFLSIGVWMIFTALMFFGQKDRFTSSALVTTSTLLGFGTFFLVQYITTGHWDAFFLIQQKYGHGFSGIIDPVQHKIRRFGAKGMYHNWQNIQSLLFILFVPVVFIGSLKEQKREILFANTSFMLFAIFPVLIGSVNLAQYRSEALLLPLVLFLGQRPKLALVLIPVFLYLTLCCSMDFFTGKLG